MLPLVMKLFRIVAALSSREFVLTLAPSVQKPHWNRLVQKSCDHTLCIWSYDTQSTAQSDKVLANALSKRHWEDRSFYVKPEEELEFGPRNTESCTIVDNCHGALRNYIQTPAVERNV